MRWTPRAAALLLALALAGLPARAADQSKSIPELPQSALTPTVAPAQTNVVPTASIDPALAPLPQLVPANIQPAAASNASYSAAPAQAAKPSAQAQVRAAAASAGIIQSALSPTGSGEGAARAEGERSFDLALPANAYPDGGQDGSLPFAARPFSPGASGLSPSSPRSGPAVEGGYARDRGLAPMLEEAVERGDLKPAARADWLAAAYRDPLTGLRNRLYLEDHLPELVGSNQTLVTLKLDALKEINDSYDHETGNKFLRALGAIASSVLGSDAALIRRSPTGFAVFLDQPPAKVRLVAEALRAAVEAKIGDPGALLPGAAGRDVGGTVSLGVASIPHSSDPRKDYAAAYDAAENARALAKESGGSRVALDEGGRARLMDRLTEAETAQRLRLESPRFSSRLEVASAASLEKMLAVADAAPAPRAAELLSKVGDASLHRALFETVYLDRLSGLPNRRWLFDNLDRIVGPDGFSSYVALDLDRFGAINERFGEEKADLVLEELGKVLSEAAREENALALHLSGEEFVLLTRGPDAKGIAERARLKVRRELGARAARRGVLDPSTGAPLTLTASFGVGSIDRRNGSHDQVLALATAMSEALLQRAKDNGRDRVEAPEDLEALLKRLIRVDETARRAVKAALDKLKTSAPPAEELFNNSWRSRSEVIGALSYNPATQKGVLLSEVEKGGQEVYRISAPQRPSRVIKIAARGTVSNELFGRNVLRGFESLNESLYAPDAVGYGRGPFLRPMLVMEDFGPANEGAIAWDTLPLKQKRALALFGLTFGIHGFNSKALVRGGWTRSALVDFEYDRAEIEPNLHPERFAAMGDIPWVSKYYLNDLADYHDAIEDWKRVFARPRTRTELAAMLRRSGVAEREIPGQLELFARNLANLERVLAADIAAANRLFRDDCKRAGLDEGQLEALGAINKAAHESPSGGLLRDVARLLRRRVAPPRPEIESLALLPEEFHQLAVRRQRGLTNDDRRAVLRAYEQGRLGPFRLDEIRRALERLDRALPPARS